MALRETKLYFETMFFDNWDKTKIHYGGEEFKNDGLDSWINLMYHPMTSIARGFNSLESSVNRGSLDIACWAKNDASAMTLVDDVVAFMLDNVDQQKFSINSYQIVDSGFGNDNMVYMYLSFDIKSYNIGC